MATKRRFRYDTTNTWFKGNTHIHSTLSDGGKHFVELAELYSRAGFHFLCRADHWLCSDCAADKNQYPLLWLDGVELDGKDSHGSYYHVVLLGKLDGITSEMGLDAAIESGRRQGALVVLAHPFWTGNSTEESLRWNFDGTEIYNHVARWLNGKGDSSYVWNVMLEKNPNTLGFAVDDAHISHEHPGWNGGWIVVNSPACSRAAIMKAIRAGNYYSSCGPIFNSIEFDGENVHVKTSPIRFARAVGRGFVGERSGSFTGPPFTSTSLKVSPESKYVYIEIEDDSGRRAWTNSLFVEEQKVP
jgi:predicted metal-dependent phosphoesterase TrpH